MTEATNHTAHHVVRKHGFVEQLRRSYRDYQLEGRAFFTLIADHEGSMLMAKHLGV